MLIEAGGYLWEAKDADVKKLLQKYMKGLAERFRQEARLNLARNDSIVTGMLHDKIDIQDFSSIGEVHIVAQSEYAPFVEFGTRPHGVSRKGILSLAKWAGIKFGLSEKSALDRAYAVARGIQKKGTRARPFFRPAFERMAAGQLKGGF